MRRAVCGMRLLTRLQQSGKCCRAAPGGVTLGRRRRSRSLAFADPGIIRKRVAYTLPLASARGSADFGRRRAWLRLFRALTETFATLTDTGEQSAPCLLVLDDLQWADELTLGWLESVLREERLNRMPCL